jgi:hypothetical protein
MSQKSVNYNIEEIQVLTEEVGLADYMFVLRSHVVFLVLTIFSLCILCIRSPCIPSMSSSCLVLVLFLWYSSRRPGSILSPVL